jgi:hypothetical protein
MPPVGLTVHHRGRVMPRLSVSFRALTVLCALFMGKPANADTQPTSVGPFTIETSSRRISAGAFPNIDSSLSALFKKTPVTDYRLLYHGKPVAVDQTDTDTFLEIRALDDAPRPAVIAATTTGAWLISEVDGKPEIRTLVAPAEGGNVVAWQWLDAAGGQPGEEGNFTIRDSSAETHRFGGGKLLMLGRRGVLEIVTLHYWPVPVTETGTLQELDGFNAGNVAVTALSPGRTQIVMIGTRRVDNLYEYALVAFDFAGGRSHAVPFDSNALRFESNDTATPEWLDHYFEWSRDPGGSELIRLRQPLRPLPWQGRVIKRLSGGQVYQVEYTLYPVGPGLADPLRALIEKEFGGRRLAPAEGAQGDPNTTSYDVGGLALTVWYDPARRSLGLFRKDSSGSATDGTYTLIERIGTRFNAILATGAHQQEFTTYLDHR